MPPLSPFLVHSLFAVGGWLRRGRVISRNCFLTIAEKDTIIYCIFHKTSVMNVYEIWSCHVDRVVCYLTGVIQ